MKNNRLINAVFVAFFACIALSGLAGRPGAGLNDTRPIGFNKTHSNETHSNGFNRTLGNETHPNGFNRTFGNWTAPPTNKTHRLGGRP